MIIYFLLLSLHPSIAIDPQNLHITDYGSASQTLGPFWRTKSQTPKNTTLGVWRHESFGPTQNKNGGPFHSCQKFPLGALHSPGSLGVSAGEARSVLCVFFSPAKPWVFRDKGNPPMTQKKKAVWICSIFSRGNIGLKMDGESGEWIPSVGLYKLYHLNCRMVHQNCATQHLGSFSGRKNSVTFATAKGIHPYD